MKIRTRKTKLYPGDKTIQIQAILKNGTIGLMNLTAIYFNRQKHYENDRNGVIFATITKAKKYCEEHIDRLM